MELFDQPTTGMLTTVAGLGLLVSIVTEVILRAWQPTAQVKDRFGPVLALSVALLFAMIGAVSQGLDPIAAIVLAVVTGGTGMGIHDTADAAVPG